MNYWKGKIWLQGGALLLVLCSCLMFRMLYEQQQALIHAQENRYSSYLLASELRHSSDELTRLVRSYVATGNPIYEKQYWHVLAIRNGELPLPEHYDRPYWDFLALGESQPPYPDGKPVSLRHMMQQMHFSPVELALLEQSQTNSDQLVKLEEVAMHRMKGPNPDQQKALSLLFGRPYHEAKIAIMAPVNQFYEELDQRTKAQVDQMTGRLDITLKLQMLVFVLTIAVIVWLIVATRRQGRRMVDVLQQAVDRKTSALHTAHHELQQAMDEIRTLRGIIPICSYCHSIRDDEGAWESLESYISEHTEAHFSHGICPDCVEQIKTDCGKLPGLVQAGG